MAIKNSMIYLLVFFIIIFIVNIYQSYYINQFIPLAPNITIEEYEVNTLWIDRGTIYLNKKYCFESYMINDNRRGIMDYLYIMKTPIKVSFENSELTLSNIDTTFVTELVSD